MKAADKKIFLEMQKQYGGTEFVARKTPYKLIDEVPVGDDPEWKPVVTRDGRKTRLFTFNVDGKPYSYWVHKDGPGLASVALDDLLLGVFEAKEDYPLDNGKVIKKGHKVMKAYHPKHLA